MLRQYQPNRRHATAVQARRILVIDLDRGTFDLPAAQYDDLPALRRAAIAALRAARAALALSVVGAR